MMSPSAMGSAAQGLEDVADLRAADGAAGERLAQGGLVARHLLGEGAEGEEPQIELLL